MLSSQRGDAATADLQAWAQEVSKRADPAVETQVLFEEDSNTFILRLAKDARVLGLSASRPAKSTPTDGNPNANGPYSEKLRIYGI